MAASGSMNGTSGGFGAEPVDLRSFCGPRYPWPFVVDLTDGDEVTACYLVHERRRAETKAGKPYLTLLLGDKTGRVEGKVWDDADRLEPLCAPEAFVGVRGRVSVWQDKLQVTVQAVHPLRIEDDDLEHFLPASRRPRAEMEAELDGLLGSVADGALQELLGRCLGSSSDLGRAFRTHPAARRNHHAHIGGLLEHSLSVASVCDRLAEHYQHCGIPVDRDMLVTGALLHDLGKLRELKSSVGFDYTTEGRLLGHIVLGIQMVTRMAEEVALHPQRLLALQHLIASHQGRPEWDSPRVPQTLEALILHYADDLDAKLMAALGALESVPEGEWSQYDRQFSRHFFRPPALPEASGVEPVPANEAAELFMDLFR